MAEGAASPAPSPVDDLAGVLLEEVARLPERYRAPVVLCDLEGRTHEQAARALGWPVGTVKSRQARARQRLRDRLTRRGVAPGLAPLAGWPRVEAAISASLVERTTVAAVRSVASRAIAPGTAAALAREVIRSMMILRWGKAASAALALGMAASGAGMIAQGPSQAPGEGPKPDPVARQQGQAADPAVVEVKPGKFTHVLVERGSVEASGAIDVLCEIEGQTTIISIKPEGSRLKQGDVVAELDSAFLRDTLTNQRITEQQAEAAYKQARLAREVAEFAVKEYTDGIFPQDREALKGKVAGARAGVEKGQGRLERNRLARQRFDEAVARRTGPETAADIAADFALADGLDAAELDLQRSRLDLEAARGQQGVLEKYTFEKNTRQLKGDVEEAAVNELRKKYAWDLEQTKGRKLERQIERCTLRAPSNGLLVYANDPGRRGVGRVQIEEGATVRERQKIFSIFDSDNDPMRINVRVGEPLVDRLKVGNTVRVRVDAAADEVLTGTVRSIAPMAAPGFMPAKVYPTIVLLDKHADLNLRPGMSAMAEILLDEQDDVLTVPVGAVVLLDGKDGVAVRTPGGGVEWRGVTLGESNDKVVVVKEGLKPGDAVLLDPGATKAYAKPAKATPPAGAGAKPF